MWKELGGDKIPVKKSVNVEINQVAQKNVN